MYNRNAAYDFGALERQKRRGQVVELPGRLARRKEKLKTKRKVLTAAFSAFMVIAAAVSTFIMGQVKITEITDQTEKETKRLNALESSNMQFTMQRESQSVAKLNTDESVHTEIVTIPKEALAESH